MPLEKVGLEAVFDTKEFTKGQRIYEDGLRKITSSTQKTAASMDLDWGDPAAGLGDMFGQMDLLEGKAAGLADEASAFAAELAGGTSALGAMATVAAGVAAGLVIVGGVAALVWRQMDDYAKEYIRTNEVIIESQKAVEAEWKKAGEYIGAAFTPVKKLMLDVEKAIAETVGRISKTIAEIAAITFSTIAGMFAELKALPGLIVEVLKGETTAVDAIKRLAEEGQTAFADTIGWYDELFKEVGKQEEEQAKESEQKIDDTWKRRADTINNALNRIGDMQRDHNQRLADMEDDYTFQRARAWAKYEQDVGKEIVKGRKAVAKLEAKYQEDRAKAIADYNKRVVEAERKLAQDIAKAQADYAMRERQTRERYNLDRVQGERRYQYERARLVAEGDTLAIEEMDTRYKLEQQEAAENEALRRKQAQETQDALVVAMEAAGRAQAEALAEALVEQLAELQEQSRKQIGEQQQTNRDRLGEMAATYADQQRMADEDYQRSIDKANLNYQRQQEDMGRDLARKEELQGLSAEAIRFLLEQYYGPEGITTNVMIGYFEGMETQANATADAVILAMRRMANAVELGGITAGHPATGYGVGMDVGGVVVGPQTVRVGAGVVEAFTPLGNVGRGGGSFDLSWSGGPIPISGLETASPTNVNEFAKALATSLTEKIRTRRRR